MKKPVILLGVLFLVVLFSGNAFPEADRSTALYEKGAAYYHKLSRFGKELPRDEWVKSIELFKTVYTKYPSGKKSPEALYMTGKLYKEIYFRFHEKADRQNAVSIFRILIKSHSHSRLADDALFLTGEVYRQDKDFENALSSYRGLLRWFPKGDMTGKARERIKEVEPKAKKAKKLAKTTDKAKPAATFSELEAVNFWSSENYARVVFKVSKMVNYRISRSPETSELTIDLLGTKLGNKATIDAAKKQGIINEINISESETGMSRIHIVLNRKHKINSMELSGPDRIVLDIFGEEPAATLVQLEELPEASFEDVTDPSEVIEPLSLPAKVKEGDKRVGTITLKSIAVIEKSIPVKVAKSVAVAIKKGSGRLAKAIVLPIKKGKPAKARKHRKSIKPDAALIEAGLITATATKKKAKPKRVAKKKRKKPTKVAAAKSNFYGVRTIVIDPGHGGKDPGAVGRSGLKEKTVTLDIGKRLRTILKRQCRCKIVMTRTKDVYIPLEQRTAIANSVNADFFISIHVNAAPSRAAHGVETFFLSPARSKSAMRTAARENMVKMSHGSESMDDINFIFSDMKNTDKINRSNKMARNVQSAVIRNLNKKYGTKDKGVKTAMFYVLHGAQMPSILVETGFISNRKEERNLKSSSFRQKVALGIASGVRNFANGGRVALVR